MTKIEEGAKILILASSGWRIDVVSGNRWDTHNLQIATLWAGPSMGEGSIFPSPGGHGEWGSLPWRKSWGSIVDYACGRLHKAFTHISVWGILVYDGAKQEKWWNSAGWCSLSSWRKSEWLSFCKNGMICRDRMLSQELQNLNSWWHFLHTCRKSSRRWTQRMGKRHHNQGH